MAKLTVKQQKFVTAKIAGRKNRDAAIEAGYSRAVASVAATKLMHLAHVKAAIAAGVASIGGNDAEDDPMACVYCEDSMEILKAVVSNPKLSKSMRTRAAEQLMPYQHARIGEKGKKEKRNDDAAGVVKGGKFAPKAQPLRLVK